MIRSLLHQVIGVRRLTSGIRHCASLSGSLPRGSHRVDSTKPIRCINSPFRKERVGLALHSSFAKPSAQPPSHSLPHITERSILKLDLNGLEDAVELVCTSSSPTSTFVRKSIYPLMKRTSNPELERRGAELTERLLFHCLNGLPSDEGNVPVELSNQASSLPFPTRNMYHKAIIAWSALRSEESAQRADRIFNVMKSRLSSELDMRKEHSDLADEYQIVNPSPCRRCYKSIIRAWAMSGATEGAARAHMYLMELEEVSGINSLIDGIDTSQGQRLEYPDRACYNLVLSSFAKSHTTHVPTAVDRCRDIVNRMDRLHELTKDSEFLLDSYSYHSLLQAYSKLASYCNTVLEPHYSNEIATILERIKTESRPDIVEQLQRAIDFAWATGVLTDTLIKTKPTKESLRVAHQFVHHLAHQNGSDAWVYHNGWPRTDNLIRLVKAWERLNVDESSDRISDLLALALRAPYDRIYELNRTMDDWSDSGYEGAPVLVEEMLHKALRYRSVGRALTGQSFATAMRAWLRSSDPDATQRMEAILFKLVELHESRGDTRASRYEPREVHVRYLLTKWIEKCRNGQEYTGYFGNLYAAEHCEKLVYWVLDRGLCRDSLSGLFALALRAWSIQVMDDSVDDRLPVERGIKLVEKLNDVLVEPISAYVCNYLLEICLRPQTTEEGMLAAYRVASVAFQMSKRNARTYALLVRVIQQRSLLLKTTDQDIMLVKKVFQECCTRGLLTQELVWDASQVLPLEALKSLLGLPHHVAEMVVQIREAGDGPKPVALMLDKLPAEWSRERHATDRKRSK